MRGLLLIVMLMTALMSFAGDTLVAQACDTLVARDTLVAHARDTLTMEQPGIATPLPSSEPKKKGWLARLVDSFSDQDTAYVEPQHYNWALMLQSVTTFDYYRLSTTGRDGQSITFAPQTDIRIGPYFGWRWIFLGYTIDLRNLNIFSKTPRIELDASIYSARFGADIFYRRTVNNYKIRSADMGKGIDTRELEDVAFDGLEVSITGLNLYYIFNYRHFSWPAAFAQNTVQRRSCGTFKLGFSFTHHKVTLDPSKLDARIEPLIDPSMYFDEIKYNDYGINFGYAYNWVPRRNWLLCASFTPQLAYNVVYVDREEARHNIAEAELNRFLNFRDNRFSIDFILRLGLVYNDTKWYAGASFILHSFNHHNEQVRFNNAFGSLNFYVGFNFKKKKEFR